MVSFTIVGLILLATVLGAVGSLFIKRGSERTIWEAWKNKLLWAGFSLYGLSLISYVFALKAAPLSVVYPMVSISYIWITLLSVKFLGEKMNVWKVVSLCGIILGVVLIGVGS